MSEFCYVRVSPARGARDPIVPRLNGATADAALLGIRETKQSVSDCSNCVLKHSWILRTLGWFNGKAERRVWLKQAARSGRLSGRI